MMHSISVNAITCKQCWVLLELWLFTALLSHEGIFTFFNKCLVIRQKCNQVVVTQVNNILSCLLICSIVVNPNSTLPPCLLVLLINSASFTFTQHWFHQYNRARHTHHSAALFSKYCSHSPIPITYLSVFSIAVKLRTLPAQAFDIKSKTSSSKGVSPPFLVGF